MPGGVPDDYVGDPREKFRLFRRVAGAITEEQVDLLREEMLERFGPVPAPVRRLLLAQTARVVAGGLGIERLGPGPMDEPGVVLGAPADVRRRLRGALPQLRVLDGDQLFLPTPGAKGPVSILREVVGGLRGL